MLSKTKHLYVQIFLLQALEMLLWFALVPPKGAGGGIDADGEKRPIKQNVIGLQKRNLDDTVAFELKSCERMHRFLRFSL